MNNELDFQVNDKVYCLIFGNGVINNNHNKDNNISVNFEDGFTCIYDVKGCLIGIIDNGSDEKHEEAFYLDYITNRTLYHYKPEIKITEVNPIRNTWVNLYRITNKRVGKMGSIICGEEFNNEETSEANFVWKKGTKYIKTVQLN